MAFATRGNLVEIQREHEKELAVAYLEKNNVSNEIEALLNRVCLHRPSDLYGHMAEHFSRMAISPVISRLSGRSTYSSRYNAAVAIDLFCTVRGKEKLAAQLSMPVDLTSSQPGHTLSARTAGNKTVSEEETERIFKVLTSVLKGHAPSDQKELDTRILSTDAGMGHALGVSFACALATASLSGTASIIHLARHYYGQDSKLGLPYLVIPVLCSGLNGIGKLRIAQFSVCPLQPSSLSEHVAVLSTFHTHLQSVLREKFGTAAGCATTDQGHCPVMDKIEQPFELIADAASAAGLRLGKHIGIVVNVGAQAMHNAEKDKYELVTGQLKTAEELVSQLETLVTKQEGVIALIDPFIPKDLGAWQKLHSLVGSSCYIMACEKDLMAQQKGEEAVNCAILAPQRTVSQTLQACRELSTSTACMAMTLPTAATSSAMEMLAGLVVLARCRFVMLPYFKHLTSVFVSQLLEIHRALGSADMFAAYVPCALSGQDE